jgi:hypothetical protein
LLKYFRTNSKHHVISLYIIQKSSPKIWQLCNHVIKFTTMPLVHKMTSPLKTKMKQNKTKKQLPVVSRVSFISCWLNQNPNKVVSMP